MPGSAMRWRNHSVSCPPKRANRDSLDCTNRFGRIDRIYHRARRCDCRRHGGWRLSRIGEPRSAIALDGALHARQTLAQVIGSHDRHQLDFGVQAKEQPLGDIGDLR